ncbi:MAG: MBL fold metallo-hydrolase [Pseudomonadota bacterium]
MTFRGTNTYVIGTDELCVVDPGPDDDKHLRTIVDIIAGRQVKCILITHTHTDHTALASRLQDKVDAPVWGCGRHFWFRDLEQGETHHLSEATDHTYTPDHEMTDGEAFGIGSDNLQITAVAMPGHTANHLCFDISGEALLSGDHVMGWATTIIAPPDGSMRAYLSSLDKLLQRDDRLFLPGHGDAITEPAALLRGLKAHRKMRERAVIECLERGQVTIPEIVERLYRDTDKRLHGAAALSVLAHIEMLIDEGRVVRLDGVSVKGRYAIG